MARRGDPAQGRGFCILNAMGENKFGNGGTAAGVRAARASPGRMAAARAGRTVGGSARGIAAETRPGTTGGATGKISGCSAGRTAGGSAGRTAAKNSGGTVGAARTALPAPFAPPTRAAPAAQAVSAAPAARAASAASAASGAPAAQAVSAATYWRRRFVVLVIGLAVLAIAAWSLSAALKGSSTGAQASVGGRRPALQGGGPPAGSGTQHSVTARGHAASAGVQNSGRSQGGQVPVPGSSTGQNPAPKHPSPTPTGFAGLRPAFCCGAGSC